MTQTLVVVTVGTDHHPFDRLIHWVDDWLATRAARSVQCVIQYGTSAPPRIATGRAYLEHSELQDLLGSATVVVSHGGPGTITESRRHGLRPIVVARSPRLGEHVDNHQELFCVRMAGHGLVALAGDAAELQSLLDQALANPQAFAIQPVQDTISSAVHRFGELVNQMYAARRQ